MTRHYLCQLDEISDPGSRGFKLQLGDEELSLFIVRLGNQVTAFSNSCPHTGIQLEWTPDQFLDIDNRHIQCATHGALFDPRTGGCVRGPCNGKSLDGLDLEIEDGAIFVTP